MTQKIYCVSSAVSLGCTFLDWSLLYLSGQPKFFNVKKSSFIDVSPNPLMHNNAHDHIKNHPSGKAQTNEYAGILAAANDGHSIFSMYPFPLHIDICCRDLGIDQAGICQPDQFELVKNYQTQDYLDMLRSLSTESSIPVIYVWHNHESIGCQWSSRALDRKMMSDEKAASEQDLIFFFRNSLIAWESMGLREIWDVRERMALDIRPFEPHWSQDLIPHDCVDHAVYCFDLWLDTESIVTDVMTRLGIDIKHDRLRSWRAIAKKWQAIHKQNMKFPDALPEIVDCIVRNKYYILPELSLYQEAIIQHCLIYQHGLNFKTWKLDKFPTNTRDLHSLLEPNIHPINV